MKNDLLFKKILQEMSQKERKNVIQTMSNNNDIQDGPKVGIFWYNFNEDELFGITKILACELQFNNNGLKTTGILHKNWWKKQQMKAIAKNQKTSIFLQDYTQIPRGRIFETNTGSFKLMCGSWITEHIVGLVKDEFDLQKVSLEIIKDEHWEIGHGFSEEYL
jgi:hypothetical protein